MRQVSYRAYVFLIALFLSLMSLPRGVSERMRSFVICSVAPCWEGVSVLKEGFWSLVGFRWFKSSIPADHRQEMERLAQENQLLKSQMENVRQWLLHEDRIQEQILRYQDILQRKIDNPLKADFFLRRGRQLCQELELQSSSLLAKVVFREPSSWSSAFWINLGEKHNENLGKKIIAKNSPVLFGTSIVGVVEYVGSVQSRVRLITDSSLNPSVRVVRGNQQNRYLMEHLQPLLFALEAREDLFSSEQEEAAVTEALRRFKSVLAQQDGNVYLAKGELKGTSHPLWRSRGQVLKGIGFNYDFADEEGPARNLRSGKPYDSSYPQEPTPLLRTGDLLVTTGLDGVFPSGLCVAIVSFVQTLKEGASSYEIEAVPTAGSLDELTHVFVLPPLLGSP